MFLPLHDDNPTVRTPVATYLLIAVNVACLIWTNHRMSEVQQVETFYRLGFVPARIAALPNGIQVPLDERGRMLNLPPDAGQIGLTLVTCMFLHGGWLHLLGNMWFLWLFGNNVEDRLGPVLFLLLYFLGGLLASGCHWLHSPLSPMPVVGASGAVAAVLGAYAVTWPWARVHTLVILIVFFTVIDLPALLVLGVWFAVQLLSGTLEMQRGLVGGVAWWAHVGGFLAGAVLMPLFSTLFGGNRRLNDRQERQQQEDADNSGRFW